MNLMNWWIHLSFAQGAALILIVALVITVLCWIASGYQDQRLPPPQPRTRRTVYDELSE